MVEYQSTGPLQPGDRAPNVVLDAITREGKIAIDDFRGHKPVLVGLFRGLHCPFCRRHIAAMAQLKGALNEKGVESLTVVNTPIERARLYFRYHPLPNLLAAADPERISHRAFGLPNLEFTENEDDWPRKVGMQTAMSMRIDMPEELPEPMDPFAASEYLDKKDDYEMTDEDNRMVATGMGQMVGQFLLDRDGVVRWCFTEMTPDGRNMFRAPAPDEVMSAASQVAH
ncbi:MULTISPECIES: peroxiredoxin-like family protein [Sinorhizobium]|uniref:AhpC/TSA family protein n=1 Tax=Sinorhizobium mexicanum TaxID=375549 RepID=A0A859QGI9_9HYPH|nr:MULTISPECIES: peroxiredoxin-like family protein [Sinorhizobium]MBP1885367.1 peroxiredoxin [Sinorhizobium mexicanum]MDK1375310.1 peroxiredoxin-like family protein [Sinorhizobium sp. 6-70]MDK1479381.1 peroxiredoxin-like family protein [Sinorhizobium sp. 6-117]QLL63184.1 AhpC/TSA family protein [Sinorhizobium mexicanum]